MTQTNLQMFEHIHRTRRYEGWNFNSGNYLFIYIWYKI